MMWIIASVPFWLLGGMSIAIAVVGIGAALKNDRTSEDVRAILAGSVVFMLAAGLFCAIAAKVAS